MERLPATHALVTRGRVEESGDFFDKMARITGRMKRHGRDRSVAEFLAGQKKLAPKLRAYFKSYVEGYHTAQLEKVSEHALSTAGEGPPEPGENDQFRIVGGYGRLTGWLLARCGNAVTLHLGHVVEGIAWKRGRVTALARRARGGAPRRFQAHRAIVALPLSVLKAAPGSPGAIRFTPEIPEKTRALSKLETGDVAKIIFRFRERFWEKEGLLARREDRFDLNFLHAREEALPTWWTSAPAQAPLLTGWTGGPSARKLLIESDETFAEVALQSLARVLKVTPRRLKSLLEDWHTHNWKRDPFSRGAYTYTGVGGVPAPRALAHPVAGTLFFAGEATDSEQSGTVAGAIASGERAARELLAG